MLACRLDNNEKTKILRKIGNLYRLCAFSGEREDSSGRVRRLFSLATGSRLAEIVP